MPRCCLVVLIAAATLPALVLAQTRDEKVRLDRERVEADDHWIYSDLPLGLRLAANEEKPLLVVFRCIPCEACTLIDEQIVARDPAVRQLMDQFVCVRIPKANALDLTQFQFDFDVSFQAFFMNADGTIYGRYGTRSSRDDADRDVSLEGFAAAMQAALRLHQGYPQTRAALAGKQPKETLVKRPEEYPALKGKYKAELDFAGATAKSCLHCHQIRDAERDVVRRSGQPWSDQVLYPYPSPRAIGLTLDPKLRATIEAIAPDSPAAEADLKAGDQIESIDGQAIISAADIQWVLHHAADPAELKVARRRGGSVETVDLKLPEGWRERTDISWRVSTWNLRRIALGGMYLESLTEEERREAGIAADQLALRARHVGQYSPHDYAKRAGLQKGDVIVAFNGFTQPMTETELIARMLKATRPGATISVEYVRGGKRRETSMRLQ